MALNQVKEKNKKWREANKDRLKEESKKYYDANKDKIKEERKKRAMKLESNQAQ